MRAAIFKPKLLTSLSSYTFQNFLADAAAGLIVGVVALPLAIAFGIASGVTPQQGLVTAIVAGFLISALGGSRVQIGGPTGAFVVIVYGVVQRYGMQGLITATFLAGLILILAGILRFGAVIEFVPHPLVVGFTSGIAVIIFSSQINDFFGLALREVPADFLEKWMLYGGHWNALNFQALFIGAGTVLITAFWPRISRKIPGSLVAIVFFSVLAAWLGWNVETIGSRFGELPRSLPAPQLPDLSFGHIKPLLQPALTIAILAGIESLLSAVVADGMTGFRHRPNTELVAQGIANVASSLFGGIPATGAIARTATNVKNGANTPVAGIIHALTLVLIMAFLAPYARHVPMACLAGILIVVSYHMSEWRSFVSVLRGPQSDAVVMGLTFLLTVLVDLTVAIEIGMVLSAFLFMHRMATVTKVRVSQEILEEGPEGEKSFQAPAGTEIYEINGPFFFGVSHQFEEAMRTVSGKPKVRIVRLRHVPAMDASGLHALKQFCQKSRKAGIGIVLCGARPQPLKALKQSGLYEDIGAENFAPTIQQAVARAEALKAGNQP